MASTYSDLKIELIGTGEQVGTWGSTTNTNLGTALGEAITGSADVNFSSTDVTLTLSNNNGTQTARNLRLVCTGTSGGARNLILGSGCQIEKLYLIQNDLADTVTVKNTTGTGVAIPAGRKQFVFNNGTNVVEATSATVNLATDVTGTLPVTNGGTGQTSYTNGQLLIGNSSGGLSKATITAGSGISVTNGSGAITIANTAPGSGTVTSVGGTGTASGLTLSGFVTESGNLTLSGSVTNAATATALQNARTIGGVSFNGTANINLPGVNTAGNQNTTGSAATLTTARTIGGVSFNGSANINLPGVNQAGTQNTSGNAATATKLTTASGSAPSFAARAWVNFNGTTAGTNMAIRNSGNVSSVTRQATGQFTVNLSTAMPDANYAVNVTGKEDENGTAFAGGFGQLQRKAQTSSSVQVSFAFAPTLVNPIQMNVVFFR
jgi:hypothetical protein